MKTALTALAAIAMLALAGIAQAAETSGKIISMDANMMILEDGTAIALPEGMDVGSLQPGVDVVVVYEERNGQKIATEVQPAQ